MNKTIQELQKLIDVNTPIIYVNDYDFVRVDELLGNVMGNAKVKEWCPATGKTNFKTKIDENQGECKTLEQFLEGIYDADGIDKTNKNQRFVILKEIQGFINEPVVKNLLQLIAQRKLYDKEYETTLIIVSSVLEVPTEIAKYVTFFEIPYPDENEINRLIDEHIKVNQYDESKFKEEDRKKLMPSLKGLTCMEIDRMLDMAMSSNGSLSAEDTEMILKQKKTMVKQSGLLELIEVKENLEIGGLSELQKYLKRKAEVIDNWANAQSKGVSMPKGVFIVGMPGCGKSLCAKAASKWFNAPLLKLDMGSMMGKYVGESEGRLRSAIKIAEAAAPCVLWIDEIEKAFSGVKGGENDILMRMFGYFLSWLQEKNSSVYVIATANKAKDLPPELKRKGRFDEIFCVNLPDKDERKEIFKIHIEKRLKRTDGVDLEAVAGAANGFNGADIESVVSEAIEESFLANKTAEVSLSTEKLKNVISKTISISKSCKQQIDEMKMAFKENCFKDATSGNVVGN